MVDYNVDVNGAFEPEETDSVIRAVKRLLDDHADIVIKYVKLAQAERKERPVVQLWPPYTCKKLESKRG